MSDTISFYTMFIVYNEIGKLASVIYEKQMFFARKHEKPRLTSGGVW